MTGMPVRLIILDTLARCFGNSDENTARDMGAFIGVATPFGIIRAQQL